RNALALRIDRENDRLELLTLLVVAHRLFAGHVPRQIGKVNETVDAAGQADEHAEVRDRLDLARHPVALVVVLGELRPRIGLALLQPERDAAAVLVDVEHHDFDLVADLHDLMRIDVLVRPIHLGDVHETLDAFLDLDEAAVVGDVRHAAEDARTGRVAPRKILPRIRAELLEAERHAIALAVEFQHLDLELLADRHDLGRMLDALPRHVRDVQQAVDAAEIDEGAVVREVLHDALQDCAFLEVLQQLLALGAVLFLDDRAARYDDVVAALIELDDLELESLPFERDRIPDRANVDERARKERPHEIDIDGEAAAHAAADGARDDAAVFERLLEARPRAAPFRLLARKPRFAKAVLDGIERDLDLVAYRYLELAFVVQELAGRYDGLGLETCV